MNQVIKKAIREWGVDRVTSFIERHGPDEATRRISWILHCHIDEIDGLDTDQEQQPQPRPSRKRQDEEVEPTRTKEWRLNYYRNRQPGDEEMIEKRMAELGAACVQLPSTSPQQIRFAADRR